MTDEPPHADESDPVEIGVYTLVPAPADAVVPPHWFALMRNGVPVRYGPRDDMIEFATNPDQRDEVAARETPLHLRGKT